jgi:hypothetical protein
MKFRCNAVYTPLKEAGRYKKRGNIAMPVVLPVTGDEFKKMFVDESQSRLNSTNYKIKSTHQPDESEDVCFCLICSGPFQFYQKNPWWDIRMFRPVDGAFIQRSGFPASR